MLIRPATQTDVTDIMEIWNPVIRDTDATFNHVEKTPDMLSADLAAKTRADHPFFVATTAGKIIGLATYGQFRASAGYRRTMEHTIILTSAARGQGTGRRLMDQIETHARAREIHSMIAGISHTNTAGIRFHAACGYLQIARLPEVGFKFDRWYDLILMQKTL